MRIAHLTDSMEVGGAEALIAQLCRRQRRAGHQPSVHCLFRLGPLGEALRQEGFSVYLHGPAGRVTVMWRLWRQFRRDATEVVHCHNATPTIIGAPAAWLAGARSIVSTRHGLVAPPYGWRREVQFSVAARLCRAVVAVCDQAAVNLKGAPLAARRKIVRIYNGTEPAPNPIEAREIPPKMGLTAITVGRLTEAKDQATLLRAVALVKPRIPDFNLWVVGGGALAESLHLLREKLGLGNTVRFLGEQKAVGGFLRQADLFVLSSISEGLPVSLLEAMAVGLPVVTTSVGGMPEVVAPSGCGLVVPSQDPAALAEAICKLAVDQGSRELMGRAGRKFFLDNFTGERMDAEYLKLY